MPTVDVIVAVRNEEETIPVFLAQLDALRLPDGVHLRVTFVEDSSTDGTRALLRRLAAERNDVGYYTLARGFGQGIAIVYGLSRTAADAVVMLDVDGSHPVSVIPEMIRQFLAGAQVVQCVRRSLENRKPYRRIGATLFHIGVRVLIGTDPEEQGIFYRLISKDTVGWLMRHPRYWTYLRFPLPRQSGALRSLEIDTVERVLGESKYHFWRLVNLAVNGVLSQIAASRFIGILAIVSLVALGVGYYLAWWLAMLLFAAVAWVVAHYLRLGRSDLLRQVEVVECANVPVAA